MTCSVDLFNSGLKQIDDECDVDETDERTDKYEQKDV